MTKRSSVAGKVTVVTGAGSGIGRAVALELARRGARLAISDLNKDGLAATAAQLGADSPAVHVASLDVTDAAAVKAYASAVREHYGVIHQVYNNAGIAGDRDLFDPAVYPAIARIINVNLWGVIHGTIEFLPYLIESGGGHLVNVSSQNGYMASPRQIGYCASKFAVRGFTEAVYTDLLIDRIPVKVSVVYPGGVRTNIATAALDEAPGVADDDYRERAKMYNEKLLTMDVGEAAKTIVNGVERDKRRILIGSQARFVDRLVRIAPGRYPQIVTPTFRKLFPPSGKPSAPGIVSGR